MERKNMVFIARSLDGYIADRHGGLDWLNRIPNPDHLDLGYEKFIGGVDAIVMGRATFDVVCSFDMEWPYSKPVFVLSNSLSSLPEKYEGKAELVRGSLPGILEKIHRKGFTRLYIDGGTTITNFLKEDLIDEITITTIPILLGGGSPLFGDLPEEMELEHVKSVLHLDALVQDTYRRKRD
jgi:dihydrofolate reductase